ncbi:MAG: DUF2867 domain-containing protein [Myxococcota bacterium]|jgi:hypothetical protein|nr:DUF2867 domain-containing protein [Myxococcota bacterium]
MRMPNEAHTKHPWRVHSLASDFQFLDVWRYPAEIKNEVPLSTFTAFMRAQQDELVSGTSAAGMLFRLREQMGELFGWDDVDEDPTVSRGRTARKGSLRHRLTEADHAATARSVGDTRNFLGPGFQPVYIFEDELLLEVQNVTVHALVHLARVPIDILYWSPQMAVYVNPLGHLGMFYMSMISPFRHGVVYPAMMRATEKEWPKWLEARQRAERAKPAARE